MNNINSELNHRLFPTWRQRLVDRDGEGLFTEDGLMYNDLSDDELTPFWNKSKRRVLFLLKEQNQSNNKDERESQDIRIWFSGDTTRCKENRELKYPITKYLAYFLWSLSKIDANNDWWFEEVEKHIEEVKLFVCTQPFAVMEAKKTPGGGETDPKTLKYHLHIPTLKEPWGYGDLIQQEVKMINPNIIVCAGSENYDFMINQSYLSAGLVKIGSEQNLRYHPQTGTLIVYSVHPSARICIKNKYDYVFEIARSFLKSGKI